MLINFKVEKMKIETLKYQIDPEETGKIVMIDFELRALDKVLLNPYISMEEREKWFNKYVELSVEYQAGIEYLVNKYAPQSVVSKISTDTIGPRINLYTNQLIITIPEEESDEKDSMSDVQRKKTN